MQSYPLQRAFLVATLCGLSALLSSLTGCSIMGGVLGDRLDPGSRNGTLSNRMFSTGADMDSALIQGELKRYHEQKALKALDKEVASAQLEGACDFSKERKVCSALEGCRCVELTAAR